MRENSLFVLFCIGCFLMGQITTETLFYFDSPKLPIIVLKSSIILDLVYFVLLLVCACRMRYVVKDVFKLFLLIVMAVAVEYVPAAELVQYYGRIAVVVVSLVWILIQSIHMLDNIQIFHNYLLFNMLNIKPWQEEQKPTALKWLYVHMALSGAGIFFITWLCGRLNKILVTSSQYSIDCISHNYVDAMYHSVVVISVLLVLLSLPRFTNKGLLMPLLLFIYQLYLCCVTMLIKISTCIVAPENAEDGQWDDVYIKVIKHGPEGRLLAANSSALFGEYHDVAHPDESPQAHSQHLKNVQFLQYACVCFSSLFLGILLFYNMSAPNMKSLHNIVRGHLCSHHTTDNSFVVKRSWLFRANEQEDPPDDPDGDPESNIPLSERQPLLSTQSTYGTSNNPSSGSRGPAGASPNRDVEPLTRIPVLTPADARTAPVPLFYIYFIIVSCYLPMYFTNWYGLGAYHVNNTYFGGNTNPAYFYHVDYVSYAIISVQVLLWVIYMFSLFSAYSDLYGFVL
jgi:hypothetical protein